MTLGATLVLICGLPGAGKTTLAKQLALMLGANPAIAQGARPTVEVGLGIGGVAADPRRDDPLPSQPPAVEIRVTL